MGLVGIDSDEATKAADATAKQVRLAANGSALQRAKLPEEGGLTGAATRLVEPCSNTQPERKARYT